MLFSSLGLCDELLQSVAEQGYIKPTPIQIEAIPTILKQRDVMAVAQTGTGKTACFILPVLQLLTARLNILPNTKPGAVRALIITPTRELAAQVEKNVRTYSKYLNIRSIALFGGIRIEPQITQLKLGADVAIATPGRLLDLYNRQAISFEKLNILVLDEADRMLDLGFIDDIQRIQTLLPINRQNLMFSATFSEVIKSFATDMLNEPCVIQVSQENTTVEQIEQTIYKVDNARKVELLVHLIKQHKWRQVLVFSRTKHGAESLVERLGKAKVIAASVHANRTQHARIEVLNGFRDGVIRVLVATDIASRGIDINQLPCVINFDLPYVPEDYVHRIGRTGRANNNGVAISFFSEDEVKQLHAIERFIGHKFVQNIIPSFAPSEKKPEIESDDDLYGNFEPDTKHKHRSRNKPRRQ